MLKTLIKLQFQKALARYTANSSNKKKNGKKSSFNSPAVYLALLALSVLYLHLCSTICSA